ncbi:hypothetical protein BC939DRAFT_227045 [Gamsiella multidivaricata]|uniref:uncharacterized protein n=1 Tax=Gamsiella multidivaricata TaxID=101098 RepID=UPI00221F46D1|nr:uncharacterized protein BC939DRAFT_226318 [Gamsiella multidivaricata]XP_051416814.1 uncharacterized protein BC939DRAFT_227045 [Gamsiella multidivaricata]KAI7831315.1 hypothetical protein BC939DRAFT_226318 [Gamsiella multidivaricata]KAI7831332.1 hypothetical protein BC939DRAFT_227045 [Gamsiella multidivaricata]
MQWIQREKGPTVPFSQLVSQPLSALYLFGHLFWQAIHSQATLGLRNGLYKSHINTADGPQTRACSSHQTLQYQSLTPNSTRTRTRKRKRTHALTLSYKHAVFQKVQQEQNRLGRPYPCSDPPRLHGRVASHCPCTYGQAAEADQGRRDALQPNFQVCHWRPERSLHPLNGCIPTY